MVGEIKKRIVQPGEAIHIEMPDGSSVKTQVEKIDDRFLWVLNFLQEDYQRLRGKLLTVQLGGGRNVSFKVAIAGSEMMGRVAVTKLIVITEPTDNNRREAFRLQKLFDLSVYRKFDDTVSETEINCQGLDISDTGLGFATDRWFDYGDIVECKFTLGEGRYHLTAKVARIMKQRTDSDEEIYRIGVLFIRIGDNVRKKIRRYIYLQQAARRKVVKQEKHE